MATPRALRTGAPPPLMVEVDHALWWPIAGRRPRVTCRFKSRHRAAARRDSEPGQASKRDRLVYCGGLSLLAAASARRSSSSERWSHGFA
jgi:hypothetical protein